MHRWLTGTGSNPRPSSAGDRTQAIRTTAHEVVRPSIDAGKVRGGEGSAGNPRVFPAPKAKAHALMEIDANAGKLMPPWFLMALTKLTPRRRD
jgi:hypothetical protein